MMRTPLVLMLAGTLLLGSTTTHSQEPPGQTQTLQVFLDGEYNRIGFDYIRTEIEFVEWVRDPADADVHIILSSQSAGGGGSAYTIDFIGKRAFEEREDSLVFTSNQTDTDDEVRIGVVQTLKAGLTPYALMTPAGQGITISYRARPVGERPVMPTSDPWNQWVFRASLGGDLEAESASKDKAVDGSISANRVTEEWKFDFELEGDYNESEYELSFGKITNYRHDLEFSGLVVRSLGDHWAAGLRASVNSSTRDNQYLALGAAPVLEFSVYPYSEFTRRRFTIQYAVGLSSYDYEEETLYGKASENLLDESLRISLEVIQPWGDAEISLEGAHYFHDVGKYNLSASSRCDIRLFRGFSVFMEGRYSRIHNQLYLARRGATDEEILLELRSLETSFEYEFSIGFSYTFGSIFNTIVNPRIGGGGGGDHY
ncbi:hypothetical protein ACFL3H_05980 [Gemmatimonadota bacterium]